MTALTHALRQLAGDPPLVRAAPGPEVGVAVGPVELEPERAAVSGRVHLEPAPAAFGCRGRGLGTRQH